MRIAVVHPEGNINNNISLHTIVSALKNEDFEIDYLGFYHEGIPYQTPLLCHARPFLYSQKALIPAFMGNYDLVIGVDEGLIPAQQIARLNGAPLGFISYEILYSKEADTPALKNRFKRTKEAARDIAFCIVQDPVRGADLTKEYGVPDRSKMYIPVAGDQAIPYQKSWYLHNLLGIDRGNKILLHMGSVSAWAMADWAVANAKNLPRNWVLVVHDRYGGQEQAKPNGVAEKVFFSNTPAPNAEQFRKIVQSADCCLGLYTPTYEGWTCGNNIAHIGLASGKIATSLQHGVPVAINSIGQMTKEIIKYGAGIIISPTSQNPFQALEGLPPLPSTAVNCHSLFNDILSFRNYQIEFIGLCSQLIHQKQNVPYQPIQTTINPDDIIDLFNWLQAKQKILLLLRMFSICLRLTSLKLYDYFTKIKQYI